MSTASRDCNSQTSSTAVEERESITLKVAIVGDTNIGKTSLMLRYTEGEFYKEYIQTLGVNYSDRTQVVRDKEIKFTIWDLGGQSEFISMLPIVCETAVAILFTFDLTSKSTLNSIKEWYRQARGMNKFAIPVLVGTKYDRFVELPYDHQDEVTRQARKFSRAMNAPLIFCSAAQSINVQKIYKIVFAKTFDLGCTMPEITETGGPIFEYKHC